MGDLQGLMHVLLHQEDGHPLGVDLADDAEELRDQARGQAQ